MEISQRSWCLRKGCQREVPSSSSFVQLKGRGRIVRWPTLLFLLPLKSVELILKIATRVWNSENKSFWCRFVFHIRGRASYNVRHTVGAQWVLLTRGREKGIKDTVRSTSIRVHQILSGCDLSPDSSGLKGWGRMLIGFTWYFISLIWKGGYLHQAGLESSWVSQSLSTLSQCSRYMLHPHMRTRILRVVKKTWMLQCGHGETVAPEDLCLWKDIMVEDNLGRKIAYFLCRQHGVMEKVSHVHAGMHSSPWLTI